MHHPTDRITHTTDFVTPVVEHWLEREIAQWVHVIEAIQANKAKVLSAYVSMLNVIFTFNDVLNTFFLMNALVSDIFVSINSQNGTPNNKYIYKISIYGYEK